MIYYAGNILEGADAKTFRLLSEGYAKGHKNVFVSGRLVPREAGLRSRRNYAVEDFIEENPDYAWFDSLNLDLIIVNGATGKTKHKRFVGVREAR